MARPPKPETPEKRAKRLEQERACAALAAMQAARPLKPPPGQIPARRATAAEIAAANDRRLGLFGATGPFLDGYGE